MVSKDPDHSSQVEMETGSVSSTQTKAEIKTEASTVWTIEREAWREFVKNPSHGLLSPPFDDGRWQLKLYWNNAEDSTSASKEGGMTIIARETGQDQRASTSTKAWVRSGLWSATCKLSSPEVPKPKDMMFGTGLYFDSNSPMRSKRFWTSTKTFSQHCTEYDVEIECTLENEGNVESIQRSFNIIGHLFFDNPQVADVVFTFSNEAAGQRRIFASRAILEHCSEYYKNLFSSGFSEASELVNIDVANLPRFKNGNVGRDEDDMGIFEVDGENDDGEAKRRKADEQKKLETESTPSLRSMIEIKVTDTCFYAYRAMLAYMHFDLLPFTALPSDYLVARQRALAEHESTSATESFTFPSRAEWLQDQFKALKGQPDWHGVHPCSPHAIYRLAHRYDMQPLLSFVKARIFRCLDTENAAYELFSPLSIVHDEIQDGILDYMSKNWGEVKETRAWKAVVEKIASGELAHAASVIKKVFELM